VDPQLAPHHKATQKHRAVEVQKSSQKLTEFGQCGVIAKCHPKMGVYKKGSVLGGKATRSFQSRKKSTFCRN
jgi:hypothetical protein